jgi:hypothetical protein
MLPRANPQLFFLPRLLASHSTRCARKVVDKVSIASADSKWRETISMICTATDTRLSIPTFESSRLGTFALNRHRFLAHPSTVKLVLSAPARDLQSQ